jgi:hypothetical protein
MLKETGMSIVCVLKILSSYLMIQSYISYIRLCNKFSVIHINADHDFQRKVEAKDKVVRELRNNTVTMYGKVR